MSSTHLLASPPLTPRAGPYPPTTATLGGLPTIIPDIPISAVFMSLYLFFALTNFYIFRQNQQRGHKFIISAMLGGFSLMRVVTLALRIAWATEERNLRVGIASLVFVNAGVLVVYVINIILAQRILRATQPNLGWHPLLRACYKLAYLLLFIALVMIISTVVISLYTLSPHSKSLCRSIQLGALTYLLFLTLIPLPHLVLSILPAPENAEDFGNPAGGMKTKRVVVLVSTLLCVVIAGFKVGTNGSKPRSVRSPKWYDGKACFYVFNFGCEVCVLALLMGMRVDRGFWVPDGCKGVGGYTRLGVKAGGAGASEEAVVVSKEADK